MALSDLQLKVASETAVLGLSKHTAKLNTFCHNFKELSDKPGACIALPLIQLSAAAEGQDWGTAEDIDGTTLTLDKYWIKSIGIDDVTASESNVNILKDGAAAIADVLGHAAEKYTMGLINATNVPVSAEVSLSSKQAFADLFAVADANGANPYDSTLVLSPTSFAAFIGAMDYIVRGDDDLIKYGVATSPALGFRNVVCTSSLPDGTVGAIVPYGTLGVASRIVPPAIDGYAATWNAVTPDELGINLRAYESLQAGKMIMGGSLCFGAKILQSGIVRLVAA